MKFLEVSKVQGSVLYECNNLSVFGTSYKVGQYVILPNSTNASLCLGKITKLLCCEKYAYLLYEKTRSEYCTKTDLFMINELKRFDVIPMYLPFIRSKAFRRLSAWRTKKNFNFYEKLYCSTYLIA